MLYQQEKAVMKVFLTMLVVPWQGSIRYHSSCRREPKRWLRPASARGSIPNLLDSELFTIASDDLHVDPPNEGAGGGGRGVPPFRLTASSQTPLRFASNTTIDDHDTSE